MLGLGLGTPEEAQGRPMELAGARRKTKSLMQIGWEWEFWHCSLLCGLERCLAETKITKTLRWKAAEVFGREYQIVPEFKAKVYLFKTLTERYKQETNLIISGTLNTFPPLISGRISPDLPAVPRLVAVPRTCLRARPLLLGRGSAECPN